MWISFFALQKFPVAREHCALVHLALYHVAKIRIYDGSKWKLLAPSKSWTPTKLFYSKLILCSLVKTEVSIAFVLSVSAPSFIENIYTLIKEEPIRERTSIKHTIRKFYLWTLYAPWNLFRYWVRFFHKSHVNKIQQMCLHTYTFLAAM